MSDIIIVVLLVMILGSASFYVYRAKKYGQKCIGCPEGKTCGLKSVRVTCGCGCQSR